MSVTYINGKVLIPIHKNASTWLRNMLNETLGVGDRQGDYDFQWKASNYKAYKVIVFVRNPWDRMLSGYLYSKKYWKRDQVKEHGPFPEFLEYLQEIEEKGLGKARWQSFKRQVDYIDVPIADLFFLGRYETLYEDFGRLCEKMEVKIPNNDRFQHYFRECGNRSRGKTGGPLGYRKYYNNDTKSIVDRLYGKDVKKFNYKF